MTQKPLIYAVCLQAISVIFSLMITQLALSVDPCGRLQQKFFSAENRALENAVYESKTVFSEIICGRECSIDPKCKSFNFIDACNKQCELSNATRAERPGNFVKHRGSVYFDKEGAAPTFSLVDTYRSCKLLPNSWYGSSGIFEIYPYGFSDGLKVYCDMETDGGGWIVFQRRQDGSVDFYRGWEEYRRGFGNLCGEFWLGNDNLVRLTSNDSIVSWELRVDLEDWDGNTAWAKYQDFKIFPNLYNLSVGLYDVNSSASDSLKAYKGYSFSTMDNDNDDWVQGNCGEHYKGAWWFKRCSFSHLNGEYYPNGTYGHWQGIKWSPWRAKDKTLKACSMKIREIGP